MKHIISTVGILALLVALLAAVARTDTLRRALAAETVPKPGTAATIYRVANLDPETQAVWHTIANDTLGFSFVFSETMASGEAREYRLVDMPAIPSPFSGTLTLESTGVITAGIIGYDYAATPTVTVPTSTPTPTSTPDPTPVDLPTPHKLYFPVVK